MCDCSDSRDLNSFPAPMVHRAVVRTAPVLSSENYQTCDLLNVLTSASGAHYEIGKVLKKAIYGCVVHAIVLKASVNHQTGQEILLRTSTSVAVKIYSKQMIIGQRGKSSENPCIEIAALQYLGDDHPNLVGQIECCMDEHYVYSIMRFVDGGELFDHVLERGGLPEEEVKVIFRQLLVGMVRLHEMGVAHRDLSLENILYDVHDHGQEKKAIIIDLGMCTKLSRSLLTQGTTGGSSHADTQGSVADSDDYYPDTINQHCGKANFMPPEVIRGDLLVDPLKGDLWSAGICLLYMLLGFPPLERASEDDVRFQYLKKGELFGMIEHWGIHLSEGALDLVAKMLQVDAKKRLHVYQCLSHPWLTGMQSQQQQRMIPSSLPSSHSSMVIPSSSSLSDEDEDKETEVGRDALRSADVILKRKILIPELQEDVKFNDKSHHHCEQQERKKKDYNNKHDRHPYHHHHHHHNNTPYINHHPNKNNHYSKPALLQTQQQPQSLYNNQHNHTHVLYTNSATTTISNFRMTTC